MLYPEMSIKEGVAKETLIGLASIRYGCSNLLYRGASLTFFQCVLLINYIGQSALYFVTISSV